MQRDRQLTPEDIASMTLREFASTFMRNEKDPRREYDLRRWERHTDNPVIGDIGDSVAEGFRQSCIATGYAATTTNKTWGSIRRIMKRASLRSDTNPRGMGVAFLDGLPWMKPAKGPLTKMPRRITLDEMTRIYVHGCKAVDSPRTLPFPVVDWWRALIVVAWSTGLRRGDLWNLRWDQIDFERATMDLTAHKTQKRNPYFPLNKAVMTHLSRIRNDVSPYVFCRGFSDNSGRMTTQWRKICAAADVKPYISLQQIRETAASEAERAKPGLGGGLLLQHTQTDVTSRFYLNMAEELREIVESMRMPIGFTSGAKLSTRKDRERQKHSQAMRPHDFDMPTAPVVADWKFSEFGFAYRGALYELSGRMLVVLRKLVIDGDPVSTSELHETLVDAGYSIRKDQVSRPVSRLRNTLRKLLGLGQWNPVPNLRRHGGEGAFALRIPEFALVNANNHQKEGVA